MIIKLNKYQLKTIIDICITIGEIGLGTVAIPILFDKGSAWGVIIGFAISFAFWYIAIRLSKDIKNE